ncbi:MAG: hypothetical protein II822_10525 [Prevotella sp.]|nr:hypothetical protein [Prevotella sp.]
MCLNIRLSPPCMLGKNRPFIVPGRAIPHRYCLFPPFRLSLYHSDPSRQDVQPMNSPKKF